MISLLLQSCFSCREIDCARCIELTEQVAVQLTLSDDVVIAELIEDYCGVEFDGAIAETCNSYMRSFLPTATELMASYLRSDAENSCTQVFGRC